jgi:uncharacterized protein YjbI with pentapeptide repeats
VDGRVPRRLAALIGGGPGSGKSTTLRALARRSADKERIRPLFIPLQYIDMDRDLRDAINSFFVDSSDSPFTSPPLARNAIEDGAPLILIFDGLDEIVAPGEAAKDMVGTFANKLNSLHTALAGRGSRKVKVVVSGRMPAFQAAQRYLTTPPHGSLEAYGFLPSEHASSLKDNEILKKDQRPAWWKQYAKLTGESSIVPEAFTSDRLGGITHEPLLCYLLALSGYATNHWELAAENRNRIYLALISSVYDRGWGEGNQKRLGPGRTLTKESFFKLMETIALAAWLDGDTRVASEQRFEEAVEIMDAAAAWQAFTDDNGDDVANLAMNFYLKASDKTLRGFEFTHKSFGEYLAARAILSIAEELGEEPVRRIDYSMQDWFRATRTGLFTPDTMAFVRDETRLRLVGADRSAIQTTKKRKDAFQAIVFKAASDGFPLKPEGQSWRSLEREQLNAECASWVVMNSYARALAGVGDQVAAMTPLNPHSNINISSIIARLGSNSGTQIIGQCLGYLEAPGQTIRSVNRIPLNFEGSNLTDCVFLFSSLTGASFSFANLTNVRFYQSFLEMTNFSNADLTGLIIHSSAMVDSNFDAAKIENVRISPGSYVLSSDSDISALEAGAAIMHNRSTINHITDRVTTKLVAMGATKHVQMEGYMPDLR